MRSPARPRRLAVESLECRTVPAVALDPSFAGGGQAVAHFGFGDDSVQALTVQPDGKIILAGFAKVGTDTDFALVRLNPDGTRDTSFGGSGNGRMTIDVAALSAIPTTGATDQAYAVTLDGAGRILVAGSAFVAGSATQDDDFAVVRLNPDGSRDTSFNGNGVFTYDFGSGDDTAYGIVALANGQIVVGGTARINADDDFAVIRLNANGTRDTSFNLGAGRNTFDFGDGDDAAFGMAVRPSGDIVLSGTALIASDKDFAIAQFNSDGSLDTAFGNGGHRTVDVSGLSGTSGGNDAAYTMTLLPDGSSILVGKARIGPDDDFAVLKFTPDGRLDASFGDSSRPGISLHDFAGTDNSDPNNLANDAAFGVATDPEGGFAVVGSARVGRDDDFAVVRYTADGVLDTDFGDGGELTEDFDLGDDTAFAVTVQPNGRIVAAGEAFIGDDLDFATVRFNSVTSSTPPPPSNSDTDGDGLLDSWETGGLDANGDGVIDLDLPGLGADPNVPDVFVEVDAMAGLAPAQAALDVVATRFAAHNIRLHSVVSETNLPLQSWPDLSGGFPVGFDQDRAQFLGNPGERASANWPNIQAARNTAFRYCIFAHDYGGTRSSGVARNIPAQDFTVTYPGASLDAQAGTYMHEMGHTLGLHHHGGADGPNPSGDYVSIMNYKFQFGNPDRVSSHPDYAESAAVYPDWERLRYNFRTGTGASAGLDVVKLPDAETDTPTATTLRPKLVTVSGTADGSARVFAAGTAGTLSPAGSPAAPFPGFGGEVRVAGGDFNGDGFQDTVLVTGPGVKTVMAVVSGKDGSTLLPATDPFGDANFTFGGFVTAGDIDHDGRAEWVVTPELRGGPRVIVFHLLPNGLFDITSPGQPSLVANFFGIGDPAFRDGDRAALGDVNGDGILDVFSIAAFNGGPRTALYNGADTLTARAANRDPVKLIGDFFAAPTGADEGRGGRSIAVGDVDGDGRADLIVTGDNLLGTGNQVVVFSGADLAAGRVPGFGATPLANFAVSGQNPTALVSVAATNTDGDARADVAVGSGPGQPSLVKVYPGTNLSGAAEPASTSFDPFGTITLNGVFIG